MGREQMKITVLEKDKVIQKSLKAFCQKAIFSVRHALVSTDNKYCNSERTGANDYFK